MRLAPAQLSRHLEQGVAPVYLVSGDEPLLIDEACGAIRDRMQTEGEAEHQRFTVETGFDWNAFLAEVAAPSLFAARRLYELRLPTGRPGEAGARALIDLAQSPPPETVLVVVTGKLDKAAQQSKWVGALDSAGAWVQVWPLERGRVPEWIAARLRARGLRAEPAAIERLAYYTEGNLLACAQEIEKLALLAGKDVVTEALVRESVGDDSRFSVYTLVDTCLIGDAAPMLRVLARLRAEGTEPILVLWALAREARSMAQIARQREQGKSEAAVLQSFHVWAQRKSLVMQAAKRVPAARWLILLRRAGRIDRILKGRLPGDGWHELERLALGFCGIDIPSRVAGGRR